MKMLCLLPFQLSALAAALVCAAGCDSTPAGRLPVYEARGSLTIDGAPAEGALLTFFGQDDNLKGRGVPVPMATVEPDGTFQVRSYGNNDGAPAGNFKVTVVWPEPTPEDADPEFYEAPDRLQGKYSNPRNTPLTATIEKGSNVLEPFEI